MVGSVPSEKEKRGGDRRGEEVSLKTVVRFKNYHQLLFKAMVRQLIKLICLASVCSHAYLVGHRRVWRNHKRQHLEYPVAKTLLMYIVCWV